MLPGSWVWWVFDYNCKKANKCWGVAKYSLGNNYHDCINWNGTQKINPPHLWQMTKSFAILHKYSMLVVVLMFSYEFFAKFRYPVSFINVICFYQELIETAKRVREHATNIDTEIQPWWICTEFSIYQIWIWPGLLCTFMSFVRMAWNIGTPISIFDRETRSQNGRAKKYPRC